MSVAKTIEITAGSPKGFEDAIKEGVRTASKSLKDITGAWVKDQKVVVNKDKVTEYRVRLKITFVLKG
jgi:flavin-binding protein dodecin